jgi:hypothetical protein
LKSIVIVFAALLLSACLPFVFSTIDSALSEQITQNISGVATSGSYNATVALSNSIFNNSITSIKSITSNQTTDAPTAYSFNTISHALVVSGLNDGLTRTLSVIYRIPSTTLVDFMATFLTLLRWFWIFIIMGMTAGAIYAFFQN